VVNSGQANAGTGPAGERDAETTTAAVAEGLGLRPQDVLACSTGVIGEALHVEEYLEALPTLVDALSGEGGGAYAEAILTTDTVAKEATATRGRYRVGGCAKGVGMIAPDLRLATMLAFVTTDAPVPTADLGRLAARVLEPHFESLTVDGCSSTNDSVLLLASGAGGGELVVEGSTGWADVADALDEVAASLVHQLASDGEGATHVLHVVVAGADSDADARVVATAIANSLLVKTAVFGGDPNPGRILQAIGASGVPFPPQLVHASIGEVRVIEAGEIAPSYLAHGVEAARAALQEHDVRLAVSLGSGPGMSRAFGVDLSYDYVKINAEYTT
jgi:glutamate N-acetyltransferase/amino-acid N-acetyltransferase